jgi:hypothetical protein
MHKNVGGYDRLARFVVGPLLVLLAAAVYGGYLTLASGLLGAVIVWAALIVGAVLLVTAMTQKCPLNSILGINTVRGRRPGGDAPESDTEPATRRPT